ncbi:MAG: thiamine pyrophosphate-binding protein [Planctomycetia bacterium]|nr:thiamine pyrophosphate-binding protein [Planctomycetia bacterium]
MRTSGAQALLQMLADLGVRHVFGNPGTTELPLVDAMVEDRRIAYILGLQEVPVVAMADGYSQASRSLGVINLHISPGLGNGMGMLYNAYRAGTPLLVTAGQQDRRLAFEEPILWSDMVRVAQPWTKWAAEVQRIQDLPSAIRRAAQTALTPPTGPVFLSLPMDLQSEMAELDLTPAKPLDPHVRPPLAALREAARVLGGAKNPAILVGSRTQEADAVGELVNIAEQLGAPVMSESGTTHGRLGFPVDHSLYSHGMPIWSPEVRQRLADFDVIFVVGMDLLRQYVYFEPARAIPEHVRVVHIDQDPWQLGKNYPVEVGLVGDLKVGLAELGDLLRATMSATDVERAKARGAAVAAAHEKAREALRREIETVRDARPLAPLTLMSTVARVLPTDVAVIEEAVTTTGTYLERLAALKNTSGYFGHRGWGLGWGLGCAIGVQLAWPDRPVLALLGEGAAMYGIQGLWTAARYRLPVTFLICNNAQYQILKVGAQQIGLPAARSGRFIGMDLIEPEIDFVTLAQSLGVEATRVTEPGELESKLRESLSGDRPRLLDVPVQRGAPSRLNYG